LIKAAFSAGVLPVMPPFFFQTLEEPASCLSGAKGPKSGGKLFFRRPISAIFIVTKPVLSVISR